MNMLKINTETEYKCLVTHTEFQRLLKIYKDDSIKIKQTNIYYCDQLNKINELEAMLRNRLYSNSNTLTFKVWQDSELLEFEMDDVDISNELFLDALAKYDVFPPFEEVAEMLTIRRLIDLPEAQLCLDENHYCGATDYEIEFELKEKGDYLNIFIDILAQVSITYEPNPLSKYQRAIKAAT